MANGGKLGKCLWMAFIFSVSTTEESATRVSSWNGNSSGQEGVTLASAVRSHCLSSGQNQTFCRTNSKNIKE